MTVVAKLGLGGTERAAQNYAIALANAGVPSAVFAHQEGGPRQAMLQRVQVPTIIASLRAALQWRPDVVHIHRTGLQDRPSSEVIAAFTANGSRIVETNVFGKPDYSKTSELIAVHLQLSEWALWKWQRRTAGIKPRPLGVVFPYAVDSRAFKPLTDAERKDARAALEVPVDAVLLGRVGQPIEAKWNVDLVHAFATVAGHNERVYLALVGAPPTVLRAVERLHPKLRDRVRLTEALSSDEALRSFYSSLDCFVHSSLIGESFGMVIIEALLCGTPVVTRIRLFRDNTQALLVNHRVTGLLTATTRGMTRALAELIRDGAGYRSRVAAARSDIVGRYSMDSLTSPLVELHSAAATMDPAAFRNWCLERFTSTSNVDEIFRRATLAYGYRPFSAQVAQLAHSAILYRGIARVKYRDT